MPELSPDDRRLLTASGLFSGLAAEVVAPIIDQVMVRAFERREVLFRQGEPVDGLYVVLAGRAKLSQLGADGSELLIRLMGPGELFAAIAALDRVAAFPVSAAALTPVRVAFWQRPVIQEIFRAHPELSSNLLQEIASRAQELQTRLREVATERVAQRVAHTLLRLAEQAGSRQDNGVLIDFPLTRQDVAAMTGTTLYTVSRLLSEWSSAGLLEVGRGRVVLLDGAGLETAAGVEPHGNGARRGVAGSDAGLGAQLGHGSART